MDYFQFDGRWPRLCARFYDRGKNCSLLYQHFRTFGFKR